MILALSTLPFAVIACCDDLADRVGLGHVRLTPAAVPPYCATYSLTIFWLVGLA